MLPQIQFFLVLISFMITGNKSIAQESTWTAPKSSNDLKNPYEGNSDATVEGKSMFKQMCVICHGRTGKGNGVAGVSLDPTPSNFLSIDVVNESDGAIFWKLTEGNPPMAAYKEILTEDQRWKLVNYIRELQNKSN